MGAEAVAAVNEHDAFGAAHEVERPVEGGVAATADDDVLAFKDGGILAAVVKLRALELLDALDAERTRLEGADAGGDDHDLGHEAGAGARLDVEAAVLLLFNAGDFLAEVEDGAEVMVLLEEVFCELVGGADGNGGNVVDGLRRIELHALAADVAKRVDDVALDFEQAELEPLEEADGTGAHDDGIGFNELIGGLGNGHIVFNSHDSVSNG